MISITGDAEGKLHVRRQVEDYALRGIEFEGMGFLNFTVETYERLMKKDAETAEENDDDETRSRKREGYRYLPAHPKSRTHLRFCRTDNHNTLPNIVGPWFPRRDGEEATKSFYYASMLALLKPWRDLRTLKAENVDWEEEFNSFIRTGSQRDRDVIAGCQYYYESKSVAANRAFEEERDDNTEELEDEDEETVDDVGSSNVTVSL